MCVTKHLKQTLVMMGSFKESKFKLTCCTGQGLITVEVVMQKLKKLKMLIVDTFSPGLCNFVH